MAIQGISNLQVTGQVGWAGLTTDNNLYAIGQREPQIVSDVVTEIFNRQNKYSFESFLNRFPTLYLPNDADMRWFLKGDDRKAVVITGFTAGDSTRPGIAKSIFQLKVAENYFVQSDFITFDDKEYGVRIMSNGFADGTDWVYEVQHMNPSDAHFIPPVLLAAGRKVSKQNNADTNVLGKDYGETQFGSHFEMRNAFSTMSKKYTMPANIAGSQGNLVFGIPDGNGGVIKLWSRYQDMVFQKQWLEEKSKRMMFDKMNMNSDGTYSMKASSGFVIKQGSGLREQISPSYKFVYNTLTLDYLWEVCFNLSLNILPEDQREFLMFTGERGMVKFHKLIENQVAAIMPYGNDKRMGGSGQMLELTGQYIRYRGPQGIVITVVKMAEYDDPIDNRLEHPEGGFAESYRYTIMNIGTTGGLPNVQKCAIRGAEKTWYVPGSVSPLGPNDGNMGASGVDGYEWFARSTQGVILRNPLAAAELIPNIVY